MQTKSSNWGTKGESISTAVTFFIDFANVSAGEIERAVSGEQFDAAEVLKSFEGVVAAAEVVAPVDGTNDWSDWADLAA